MTDEYIAGFFDGEGNVCIGKDLSHICVSMSQTSPNVLMLIQQRYGGKVTETTKKNKLLHWKRAWDLRFCNSVEVKRFLEAIQPYVYVKRGDVEIGLEFLTTRIRSGKGGGRASLANNFHLLYRRQMLRDSLLRNHRGVLYANNGQ